jgi:D-psicose/D-tagatose/L-ribulose 3-epimerase
MKFGVNTFIWGADFGPSEFHLLPRIKEHGFDGIEVPILNPSSFKASQLARELDQVGLTCTAVTVIPGGSSLASADEGARRGAREHLEACIAVARDAGARILGGPLYSPVGYLTGRRRTSDEWKWVVDGWQQLRAAVQSANIEVAIEPLNRFETYFLNTAADAGALCDQIGDPAIGILLDTFHANIEEKSMGETVRHAAPHLKHLHTCENDRGIPGSGHVAWPEFFAAVSDVGYDRWLTIESFAFAGGPVAAAASIWRDLAPTPEAIAFEGVTFLRRNVQPT